MRENNRGSKDILRLDAAKFKGHSIMSSLYASVFLLDLNKFMHEPCQRKLKCVNFGSKNVWVD